MVPVEVGLSFSKVGFVMLLSNSTSKRTLPVYIGTAEAQSILLVLNGQDLPRPMTHDLLVNLLGAVGAGLQKVEITKLEDGVFYAVLRLRLGQRELEVDARPSDAVALALRCQVPVLVAEAVMAEAGIVLEERTADKEADADAEERAPEAENQEALLKRKLAAAVEEERYEDAARLRDEIKRLSGAN